MTWAIPKRGQSGISSTLSHQDPAFASDFNSAIPDSEFGGVCVLPTIGTEADLDIEAGRVHEFDSVDDMLDSLGD